MDIGRHHLAQGEIDDPVTCQRRFTYEKAADDFNTEVTPSITRPGVPRMQVTVVLDHQTRRSKRRFQQGADALDTAQGNTLRKGLTSTRA